MIILCLCRYPEKFQDISIYTGLVNIVTVIKKWSPLQETVLDDSRNIGEGCEAQPSL